MKYSVVTCTFNSKEYVDSFFLCMKTIEYDDFEVVIVDDASTDGTYMKLSSYMNNTEHKLILFQQDKNSGPGAARNKALDFVNGEYILFIDIDDKVNKNIFNILDQYDADCIFFDYFKWYSSGKTVPYRSLCGEVKKIDDVDEVLKKTSGAVWGKLFKKEIIDKFFIRFPELYKTEDLVFIIRYLLKCGSVEICRNNLYYYRISDSSLMHRNISDQVENARRAMEILKIDMVLHKDAFLIIYAKEIIYDLTNVFIKMGKSRKELIEFWEENDVNQYKNIQSDYLTKPQRIILFLICHKCYFAIKMINVFR